MKTRVAVAERLPGAAFVSGVLFTVRSVHAAANCRAMEFE
jgi:hypothetical protein